MKKLFLLFAISVAFVCTGFAQKANVAKAKNKALAVENPDFQGAKNAIEAALVNDETKGQANTWWTAGLVYEKAADAEFILTQTGSGNVMSMGEDALKCYEYYLKADELDQLPNEKGKVKPKFTRRIATSLLNIYNKYMLVNYGVEKYQNQEWQSALNAFETHTAILDLPFVAAQKDIPEKDTTYYQFKYYAATCAWAGEMNQKAIELFSQIKDKKYNENAVYQALCQIYQNEKDTVNYISTLEEGLVKFPDEFYYLGNLINHYVFGGQPQKATELLDKAIAADSNNAQLYSVRGSMLEVLEDFDGAMSNFDKAISIKPDFAEAWLGKARLIYNKAFKMEQKALEIRDFKLSDQEISKALEVYKESIPYFEKAIELKPDYETMRNLKSLFYKLSNSDSTYQNKYEEITNKMNNL